MNPLDNPIWTALTTRHAELSEGDEIARRYLPSYTTLAGMAQETDAAFASLAQITAPTQRIGICSQADIDVPSTWICSAKFPVAQMICDELLACRTFPMEILTDDDVPEMKELVMLTQPGPFANRTIKFGTFLAIKENGKIAAMAGQRMKVPGYDEVSAVCTHPDHQGKGYARALVHEISKRIVEGGSTPMLHVRSDNLAAIKSYEHVGFRTRREFYFSVLKPALQPT
ncbi:MAG TPA: GNAT family N-acetyltransferase [Drouetiella sp.]